MTTERQPWEPPESAVPWFLAFDVAADPEKRTRIDQLIRENRTLRVSGNQTLDRIAADFGGGLTANDDALNYLLLWIVVRSTERQVRADDWSSVEAFLRWTQDR